LEDAANVTPRENTPLKRSSCFAPRATTEAGNQRSLGVTKREIMNRYRQMSPADQAAIDRWIRANVVIGSIIAGGLLLMALASSNANLGPDRAVASSSPSIATKQSGRSVAAPLSPFELMGRLTPGELPVRQVDEPF
jgi:hypothetical protein